MTAPDAATSTSPVDPDTDGRAKSTRGSRRSTQIMQAAAHLFQDAGYQNVSIDDIGAAVGLTGPAVYRHFKGKHDILVRTLIGQVELVEDMARRAAGDEGTPESRMEQFVTDLEELSVFRDEAMLWRRERRHLQPTEQEAFRRAFGTVLGLTEQAMAASRPDLTDGQLELLSLALLSLFGNTRDIRVGLDAERLATVQSSIARSIVNSALPAEDLSLPSAPIPEGRTPAGRRERIVHASAELFDTRGFYDVRVDDIAKAAGMSVATLYQHFPNKTDILQAILQRGAEGLLYVTAEALGQVSDPRHELDILVTSYIDQALGLHGRTMRILVTDAIYLTDDVQEELRTAQREYVSEWIEAICALRPDLTAADARAVAHSAINVITDMSQTQRMRLRPGIRDELTRLALTMVLPGGDRGTP